MRHFDSDTSKDFNTFSNAAASSKLTFSQSIPISSFVTSSVNNVSFGKAIPIGTTVTIEAKVSRAFTTSMEVFIDVWVDDDSGKKIKANEAIYTFVAVDSSGRPTKIDPIRPETEEEKKRYDAALRRKQLSLVLAGKMKADDATELKALFS